MNRALLSTLCGLFTLVSGYVGNSSMAQACSCLVPEVTRNYAEADRVYRGQVIWSIELGIRRYYLVRPLKAYKGCVDQKNLEWVSTARDSATCGTSFSMGEEYLLFTDQDRRLSWSQTTSLCSGNRVFSSLNEEEKGFLDSRYNCCEEDCSCTDGSDPVNCLVDPCSVAAPCDGRPDATCVSNDCGGCKAEFVDDQGALLTCEPQDGCTSDKGCEEDQYCGAKGQCVNDGRCSMDYECNLPGNTFDYMIDCAGYGECRENRCEFQCGDRKCINHEGYDFGECKMIIGYVRLGDTCQSVSGCDSLIPGDGPAFATKQACEKACALPSTTFACGDELRCELGSQFCQETIPGVAPEPGTQVASNFDCMPFEVACDGVPSCEACIEPGPLGGFGCVDKPNGAVQVTIPLP